MGGDASERLTPNCSASSRRDRIAWITAPVTTNCDMNAIATPNPP